MAAHVTTPPTEDLESPPRAFTQGVGLVFQWLGVVMFLAMMFVCCSSSLLSKDVATHTDLGKVGWGAYSAQFALTLSVTLGVFFGMALAGVGLGLQAQDRRASYFGLIITFIGVAFWVVQAALFATTIHSIWLTALCAMFWFTFIALFILAIGAFREMRRDPPPDAFVSLPADYKVPYSHMHDDPPDVRYAAELQSRRERLAIQQKELEALEAMIRKRMNESKGEK